MVYHSITFNDPLSETPLMHKHLAALPILALLSCFNAAGAFAQPAVVTTIKPLQFIAAAVMDGVAQPEVLIPSTQSPHHYTLRPSDVGKVSEARLILWVGPQMETYLEGFMAQLVERTVVIEAGSLPGIVLLESGQSSEEHVHEEADNHGLHDPHLWLNTENAELIARRLSEELIVLDPVNAARYEENLTSFVEGLRLLEDRLRREVAGLVDGRYALYHNGIQYFEKQFGLEHQFVLVPDHEIQPGIRHLLALRELLENRPLTCVLEDVNANEATINTVFRDYPVNRVRIDTMGDTIASDRYAYVRLVENMTLALRHCLGR